MQHRLALTSRQPWEAPNHVVSVNGIEAVISDALLVDIQRQDRDERTPLAPPPGEAPQFVQRRGTTPHVRVRGREARTAHQRLECSGLAFLPDPPTYTHGPGTRFRRVEEVVPDGYGAGRIVTVHE